MNGERYFGVGIQHLYSVIQSNLAVLLTSLLSPLMTLTPKNALVIVKSYKALVNLIGPLCMS